MENNSSRSPILIVNKLTLVGSRKNYVIPFSSGLNIIHGDSDTGKSSILNLIDYCLGSADIDLYNEIENSGKYCLLEVDLNGKVYTIKRNIFEPSGYIEVFHSDTEGIDDVFPLQYGPNYAKEGHDGFISDFFLDALSIPKIETKQSPSKADSKMIKLSFRDILKYNYLTQDDVGSKDLLDRKNFSVAVKNQETFKFLHNLLDINITELQRLISQRTSLKKELDQKYTTIASFFRETQLRTEEALLNEKTEIQQKLVAIDSEIEVINKSMLASTQNDNELREMIADLQQSVGAKIQRIENLKRQISQNILLKNDYAQDIQKLKTSIHLSETLPPAQKTMDCPVCSNVLVYENLAKQVSDTNPQLLENELRSINRRSKDISDIIEENRNEVFLLEVEVGQIREQITQAKNLLDNQTKELISPFLAQRDGLLTAKAKFLEALNHTEYTLKIRNQLSEVTKRSAKIALELEKLNLSLEELKANTPTIGFVTNNIADYLKEFLTAVKMNHVYNVAVDSKSFLPKVRDKEYWQLTSGGVRTLVSVGYFIALLQNSASHPTNHPTFLMIDTIAKYLGKTKPEYLAETDSAEDIKEGIVADDPTKYINMYNYLLKLCEGRADLQIIIVDNDIPQKLETNLRGAVVKQFSVDGYDNLPRGFIDDAYDDLLNKL
ncbi:hypothetical protein LLH06_01035 [Mucilaginibacter daejeonensis]|uniref:AAA family ATPase n=1 Tax=Mucilaginibacter daejeonensis TaxID=398049 RepID=UPI001D176F05|nr:hypothetical protein [Mucilaginibacter daejeonensis]UEG53560.1 hypothetical protein LLH06_01035 [Mucilaginibacter daejeonensis]